MPSFGRRSWRKEKPSIASRLSTFEKNTWMLSTANGWINCTWPRRSRAFSPSTRVSKTSSRGVFLRLAPGKKDEKAYLYTDDGPRPGIDTTATATATKPALVIQLTVDTLLAMDKLEPLLMTTLNRARRPC